MARKPKTTARPKTSLGPNTARKQQATHLPDVTAERHAKILENLLRRLGLHLRPRAKRNKRYDRILAEIAVQQVIDQADFKEYSENERSAVRNIRYPKTYGHLKDLTVNVMDTLFPMQQMYGSIAVTPEKQQDTTAFLQMMNRSGRQFNHYINYYNTVFDGLAFNAGFAEVDWKAVTVNRTTLTPPNSTGAEQGRVTPGGMQPQVAYSGNEIRYLDPYNCFWEEGLSPSRYHQDATFFAYVERKSDDELRRLARYQQIILPKVVADNLRTYDPKREEITPSHSSAGQDPYYYARFERYAYDEVANRLNDGLYIDRPTAALEPILAQPSADYRNPKDGSFDIDRFINSGNFRELSERNARVGDNELLQVYVRDTGQAIGFNDDTLEVIYQFTILNGEWIVGYRVASAAHGFMPIISTQPATELGLQSTPSVASILAPYQYLTNSLLSTYVDQAIKAEGILAYNRDTVDMQGATKDRNGMLGLSLDTNNVANNDTIARHVTRVGSPPPDSSLLNAEAVLRERANDFTPTASSNQLAALNRPVSHQSRHLARVMNLHTNTMSRIIAEQLIRPGNMMQAYNIINYADKIDSTDENGLPTEIDPVTFADLDLSTTYSDGMLGLDTISIVDRFEKLINAVYQSPELQRTFDVAKMTTFLFQMEGADVDADSFKYRNEFDALPMEAKQQAMALLQQAAAQQQEGGANPQQSPAQTPGPAPTSR